MKKIIIILLIVLAFVLVAFFILTRICRVGMFGDGECCPGLVKVPCYLKTFDGQCVPTDCGYTCVRCGDRKCGLGANYCNCPKGCSR